MSAADSSSSTPEFVARWKRAGEQGDVADAVACLAKDVELVSPLTAQYRFTGRDQVHDVLASAFEVVTQDPLPH